MNQSNRPTPSSSLRRANNPATHETPKKPCGPYHSSVSKASRRHMKRASLNGGVIAVVIVFIIVAAIAAAMIIINNRSGNYPKNPNSATSAVTEAVTKAPELPYELVSKPHGDIYSGNLILINYDNEYKFPESATIVDIADINNGCYYEEFGGGMQISDAISGEFNALTAEICSFDPAYTISINSSYRTYEYQQWLYDDTKEAYGADYARKYVAAAGFSEHHTGLAVDMSLYSDGVNIFTDNANYAGRFENDIQRLRATARKHGFILRYTAEKQDKTGISPENWHYRYVGIPHAQIMFSLDYCLEEYIAYLRSYTYDSDILIWDNEKATLATADNLPQSGYAVYFTPAGADSTDIKVPRGKTYTVSGNNIDGFIVTVDLKNT